MMTNQSGNGSTGRVPPPLGFPPTMNQEQFFQQLEEMVGNLSMARTEFFRQLMDPRRNLEDECGYPRMTEAVSTELYKQLYDREAIAARVVEVMPKECWQVQPMVYEDEDSKSATPFEEAWDDLGKSLSTGTSWHQDEEGSPIWEHLLRVDILSGIGHFGVLLLGIDDGKNLQDPVDGVVTMNRRVPVYKKVPFREWKSVNGEMVSIVTNRWTQVGTKISTDPKDRPVPDSSPTEDERRVLQEMVDSKQVTTMNCRWDKAGYHEDRQSHPANYLNSFETTPQPSHIVNESPTDLATNDPGWGGATGSPQLPGTDSQYAWQGAMPPASLSGTDQQYFGVQFGPTEQPSDKPAPFKEGKGGRKLLFIRAFDESLVQIVRYEWNIRNPRFGQPVMYRITLNDPREQHSGVGLPLATVFVHWSRVIHVADNLKSSEIFGTPRQRPVLNRLLDLRKVYGAGAEGYWKSCFTGLAFSTHPQLGGEVQVDQQRLRDTVEQYQNGLQRFLAGIGGAWSSLAPSVVDPSPHIEVQIEAICIQLGCPVRVFKGSERGELASSQDDASWNDRVRARQHGHITPRIIVVFIDRLISMGILPEPEGYSVEWPDLNALNDADKAAIFLQIVQALSAYVAGNVETICPPMELLTKFLKLDEEEAKAILKAALKNQEDTMTMPPIGDPGHPASETPEPVVPPANPVAINPGQTLVHPQTGATVAKGAPLPVAGGGKGGARGKVAPAKPVKAPTATTVNEETADSGESEDSDPFPSLNVFCPTGSGGGIDPGCGRGGDKPAKKLIGEANVLQRLKDRFPEKLPEANRLIKARGILNKAVKEGRAGPATVAKAVEVKEDLARLKAEARADPRWKTPDGGARIVGEAKAIGGAAPVSVKVAAPAVREMPIAVETTPPPAVASAPGETVVRENTYQNSPKLSVKNLGGGINGSYKMTLASGDVGVWKPVNGERGGLRNGIAAGTYYKREAAAYSVAKVIGMTDLVPVTVEKEVNGVKGSIQQWRENAHTAADARDMRRQIYDGDKDLARAAAYDHLIGNTDRHEGNWMVDKDNGSLTLIDHGLSFPRVAGQDRNEFRIQANRGVSPLKVPKEVLKWDAIKIDKAMEQHGLSPQTRELTLGRLKELQDRAKDDMGFSGLRS